MNPHAHTEITFPTVDGRRPTTPAVRRILAEAVRDVDAQLAADVEGAAAWRTDYVALVGRTTAASAESPKAALLMAQAGIAAMHAQLVAADGTDEVPLAEWAADRTGERLTTTVVRGSGAPVTELGVPYRGETLRGDALRNQLAAWRAAGTVEPSFVDAIEQVLAHPEWLALPGRTVALLGAGAEMSPYEALTSWGADVLAVDVPVDRIQDRVRRIAENGAGTTALPVGPDAATGADLVRQTASVLEWLSEQRGDNDLVVGMHAYADGGAHVAVTAAVDALSSRLSVGAPRTALAYLATPTDAFLVPPEVVAAGARAYQDRGAVRWVQAPLRTVSGGRLFRPNYRDSLPDGSGVADILVPQQGPNYAMAKRLQRWRGLLAEDAGQQVSFNVAPATWTHSVTKNRVLAAAYGGAHHFGVEVFAPETTRALMAALLVHDLNRPVPQRRHPEDLFSEGAAHGGLWRVAYEPRSALGVAAVGGLRSALRRR